MTKIERPKLSEHLDAREFLRWYWLKSELLAFARSLGIRSGGSKELLTRRIAATLDGHPFAEPEQTKPHAARQLSGALDATTVIPKGQRCSAVVRAWFVSEVGSSFRFDQAMREFFALTDGTQTLRDALDHYHLNRADRSREIASQFEYNRFTKAWWDAHPNGSRDAMLAAWHEYRTKPIDGRS